MSNLHGMYIITHSRQIIQPLMPLNPTHWHLGDEYMTLNQYLNRSIKPVDLEEMLKLGKQKWHDVYQLLTPTDKS